MLASEDAVAPLGPDTPAITSFQVTGGDGLIDAVEVGGAAVVVARGEFRL